MASRRLPALHTPRLFGPDVPAIEGFLYQPDLLSAAEERAVLQHVRSQAFHPFTFRGVEARRRVAHFGRGYSFDRRALTDAPPLPDFLLPLAGRVASLAGVGPSTIAEALVTWYPPGAGIGWHRDAPPFDVVMGVSLLSACRFRLRPYAAAGAPRRGAPVEMTLEPRSAYVLAGAARADWEHSIPEGTAERYSVTFRTLRASRAP